MAKRPYKRRQILIDRFQYQLLLINLLYFFTILLIFSAALFVPLIIQLDSHTLSLSEQEAVASQFLSLHARVWPALLLAFLLFAIHSIFVSHRIAGPLMRFRNTFKAIAAGDLSGRVTLRKHDYLGHEADALNEMIAGLRRKIKDIDVQHREVRTVLSEINGGIERGSVEGVHHGIGVLGVQMQRLRDCIDQFRLPVEEARGEGEPGTAVVSASTPEQSSPVTHR
jgi:methyl-accepting chemotaxis protein